MSWTLYILRCADDTLYTGITKDLNTRLQAHNAGKGAKYTRGRGPVEVVWFESDLSETQARTREYEMKKLSRQDKLNLIQTPSSS